MAHTLNLIAPTVDGFILSNVPPTLTDLLISDSSYVTHIAVPKSCTIQSLLVVGTRLRGLLFEQNERLLQLFVDQSELNHVPETLVRLRKISTIKINRSLLRQLELSFFCDFPQLTLVDVEHNRIQTVSFTARRVKCDSGLKELVLGWNWLKTIDPSVFTTFGKLGMIALSNNYIKAITGRFVSSALYDLSFSNNSLSQLSLCEWSPTPTAFLSLERNKLTEVPICLGRMAYIRILNLDHNRLSIVTMDDFKDLRELEYLRLSWNLILSFTMRDTFVPPLLISVDIRGNRLQQLNVTILFIGLVVAFEFTCSKENAKLCIVKRWNPTYDGLFLMHHVPSSVQMLWLFQLISPTVDRSLLSNVKPTVTELLISDSSSVADITVPKNCTIKSLRIIRTKLCTLQFERNDHLSELIVEKSELKQIPPSLGNVYNLSHIKINFSPVWHLELSFFCDVPQLVIINLKYNQISSVSFTARAECNSSLVELILSHNRLKIIDTSVFAVFDALDLILLADNYIGEIVGRFTNGMMYDFLISNNSLSHLNLCDWSPMPEMVSLFLEHNKIAQVPPCLARLPNLYVVNLEHNLLSTVAMEDFKALGKLEYLRLSWNPIVSFSMLDGLLPPKLVNVDLTGIRLQQPNVTVGLMSKLKLLFFVGVVVLQTAAFQFRCNEDQRDRICTLANYDPQREGTFVLNHVPRYASNLVFQNILATTLDHRVLGKMPATITAVTISDSNALRQIVILRNSTLQSLTVSGLNIGSLRFEPNGALTYVSIKASSFRVVPPALGNLRNLAFFKFSESPIEHVFLGRFCNFTQLDDLNLRFNFIATIGLHNANRAAQEIECAPKLRRINLANNKLKRVNMTLFGVFRVLEIIDLMNNEIQTVGGRFTNVNITTVILSDNQLMSIDLCRWNTMARIKSFSFLNNNLSKVPACLGRMPDVRHLDLSYNKLATVAVEAFARMKALSFLFLNNNAIASVTSKGVSMPPNLKEVYLRHNCLESSNLVNVFLPSVKVPVNFHRLVVPGVYGVWYDSSPMFLSILMFCTLSVRVIGMKWVCEENDDRICTIERLDPMRMNPANLRRLSMGMESLTLANLETSTLDHSILSHIVVSYKLHIVDSRALQRMIVPGNFTARRLVATNTHLSWIHFQENDVLIIVSIVSSNLQQLPPSLKNLTKLRLVKIQQSYLQHLDLDILRWFPLLEVLDLKYNRIKTITSSPYGERHSMLNELQLSNNQLKVLNLELLAPLGWFQLLDLRHNQLELIVGRFAGIALGSLLLAHNRLRVLDFCQWEPMPGLTSISFESNELTSVPNCLNRFPGLVYVSFIGNRFTEIDMGAFGPLHNLTMVDFSSNSIERIAFREDSYPVRLEELILRDNTLKCSKPPGVPFCPLDIELGTKAGLQNGTLIQKQLIITTA
uniref:Chaoptin n=1 Tax=Anopheles farauti TaxID=69004 RepID=A0A182Q366_9DIPT